MIRFRSAALAVALLAGGLALGLIATDVVARPKPVVIVPPPEPPPPPPMPAVGMDPRLVAQAAAYADYMQQASQISPAFSSPDAVASSLRAGVAYEPEQFRRGEVAFAAIAALQDAAFVQAVRAAGPTPEARYAIVKRLYADPANALTFTNGVNAAGIAKQAIAEAGMKLFNEGNAVRRAAYDVQHQPWSLQEVVGRDQRASLVKTLSATRRFAPADEVGALDRIIAGAGAAHPQVDPAPPPYSPLVIRAVALAALAAIGQAGDVDANHLSWLSDDYFADHCLAEAKLDLFECIAVAKPNYEDVFCLGQHAMKDTGTCVVQSAGAVVPLEIATTPLHIPRAHIGAHRVARRRRA